MEFGRVDLFLIIRYWYYSAFTMLMLFVFENTLISQRIKNLSVIRDMVIEPIPLYVFRNSKWSIMKSDKLLPNDLVSITK
jgi:manganese-transporting P-type ATPase